MAKRAAKFRVGQVVFDVIAEDPVKIYNRLHDPSDGWEYQTFPNSAVWTFEENLRPLTKHEAGR